MGPSIIYNEKEPEYYRKVIKPELPKCNFEIIVLIRKKGKAKRKRGPPTGEWGNSVKCFNWEQAWELVGSCPLVYMLK